MIKITGMINALRVGASVKNQTGVKWAGTAVAAMLLALMIAKSFGYLEGVQNDSIVELVMVLVVLYSQLAGSTDVGLLPRDQRASNAKPSPELNAGHSVNISDDDDNYFLGS